MARPKIEIGKKQALERIEEAFWRVLSQGPYAKITIALLAQEASVNHNTIYYYFENIDDMATKLFKRNMAPEMAKSMLDAFISGNTDLSFLLMDENLITRWLRAKLYTRGDSAFLVSLFKASIIDTWLSTMGLTIDMLTKEDQIDLEFVFSGLIAIIGSTLVEDNPALIAGILNRDLGHGITSTLCRLALKQQDNS